MFNLFKKKLILADLIPEGFVDIHSHILPGIDDGAKNIEESLSLISQMKEMGFLMMLLHILFLLKAICSIVLKLILKKL